MIKLNVVTPERAFLSTAAKSVTLPGELGHMQILPGHTPALFALKTGLVAYESDHGAVDRFMIASGFVEIDDSSVNVLCDLASFKSEIDQASEEQRKAELLSKAGKVASEHDEHELRAELEKSVARLSLFE